mmetsp:Transcript_38476/g.80617  ORF Transcript_38476/g.80617 Transcript_38476/m.80617 type:complete len:252 (+) Transcript_38476:539-1294(+)
MATMTLRAMRQRITSASPIMMMVLPLFLPSALLFRAVPLFFSSLLLLEEIIAASSPPMTLDDDVAVEEDGGISFVELEEADSRLAPDSFSFRSDRKSVLLLLPLLPPFLLLFKESFFRKLPSLKTSVSVTSSSPRSGDFFFFDDFLPSGNDCCCCAVTTATTLLLGATEALIFPTRVATLTLLPLTFFALSLLLLLLPPTTPSVGGLLLLLLRRSCHAFAAESASFLVFLRGSSRLAMVVAASAALGALWD